MKEYYKKLKEYYNKRVDECNYLLSMLEIRESEIPILINWQDNKPSYCKESLQGYIKCHFIDLVKIFGFPRASDILGYKNKEITVEWHLLDPKHKIPFTIHDYENHYNYYDDLGGKSLAEITNWHIDSISPTVVIDLQKELFDRRIDNIVVI